MKLWYETNHMNYSMKPGKYEELLPGLKIKIASWEKKMKMDESKQLYQGYTQQYRGILPQFLLQRTFGGHAYFRVSQLSVGGQA